MVVSRRILPIILNARRYNVHAHAQKALGGTPFGNLHSLLVHPHTQQRVLYV